MRLGGPAPAPQCAGGSQNHLILGHCGWTMPHNSHRWLQAPAAPSPWPEQLRLKCYALTTDFCIACGVEPKFAWDNLGKEIRPPRLWLSNSSVLANDLMR